MTVTEPATAQPVRKTTFARPRLARRDQARAFTAPSVNNNQNPPQGIQAHRSSSPEKESRMVSAPSSSSEATASAKETPCFRAFSSALPGIALRQHVYDCTPVGQESGERALNVCGGAIFTTPDE